MGAATRQDVWFAVSDADATAAVAGSGATILREPQDMQIGRSASLNDPQGASFSIIATKTPE